MTVGRLLRCHPFVKGGYDPVVRETLVQQVGREKYIPADSTAR